MFQSNMFDGKGLQFFIEHVDSEFLMSSKVIEHEYNVEEIIVGERSSPPPYTCNMLVSFVLYIRCGIGQRLSLCHPIDLELFFML